jgi:hypothetical protein
MPVNPDSARDSGYFIYLVTVELGEQMAMMLPEVELLKTIPGLGDQLAAVLAVEIGDASQFETPKQLVAYAGLDPGVYSSGKFTASRNHIRKEAPSDCAERSPWPFSVASGKGLTNG